jgi:ribosomal protein L37E
MLAWLTTGAQIGIALIVVVFLIWRAIDRAAMYCPRCGAISVRNDVCSVCGWDLAEVTGYVSSDRDRSR